jgi:hypothetical protein
MPSVLRDTDCDQKIRKPQNDNARTPKTLQNPHDRTPGADSRPSLDAGNVVKVEVWYQ